MLSISNAIAVAQGGYFTSLAREDYYTEGGEPTGRWFGRGLSHFGLSGEVDSIVFQNLLRGYSPDGREALVQNAGDPERQAAWDLTFSAPKSVSVLWSQADTETQSLISDLHAAAVEKALTYLEDVAAFSRLGHAGERCESARWIIATFEHATSRAQDPQLHTHAVLLNIGIRGDGTTGTLVSQRFFQHKMAAGALYRAELAFLLQERLSLRCRRVKNHFEVEGVSPALVAEFSKRRQQVEAYLKEHGQEGAVAAKEATLYTRAVKEHLSREILIRNWQETGRSLGWRSEEVQALLLAGRDHMIVPSSPAELLAEALNVITTQQSFFTARDLVWHLAEAAQGKGLGAAGVRLAAEGALTSAEIVFLGEFLGERQFTTREMLRLERELLNLAMQAQGSEEHVLPSPDFHRFPALSTEQQAAVSHLITKSGAVQMVSGIAGSGKSTLLDAARILWQEAGFSVWGAALSGKAARGLETSAHIPSVTVAKLLLSLAAKSSPYDRESSPLDERSVLVLDEAGMLGTRQMKALLEMALGAGAKVVLVGDSRQLQPIEAGGPFRALSDTLGAARLTTIQRQRAPWARDVVRHFAAGRAEKALNELTMQGLVTVTGTHAESITRLIADWREEGASAPERNLILSNQNEDVHELNREAQAQRLMRGDLSEVCVQIAGENFHCHDRVLFTRNSSMHGVNNGMLGTVTSLNGTCLTVTLDTGSSTKFALADYDHLRLGYAVTTHKAQGMTAENVFVLAGDAMQDREISYVQSSRAKGLTRLYLDHEAAGEELENAIRRMSTSHQKLLANELFESLETKYEINPSPHSGEIQHTITR